MAKSQVFNIVVDHDIKPDGSNEVDLINSESVTFAFLRENGTTFQLEDSHDGTTYTPVPAQFIEVPGEDTARTIATNGTISYLSTGKGLVGYAGTKQFVRVSATNLPTGALIDAVKTVLKYSGNGIQDVDKNQFNYAN